MEFKGKKCRWGISNSGKRLIKQKIQSGNFPNILISGDFLSGSCVLWPGRFFFVCVQAVGCLSLEHNGSDTILMAYGLFWSSKVDLLVASWSQGGPCSQFWNNSFLHALTTKLINYYLKLKISNFWVPPSKQDKALVLREFYHLWGRYTLLFCCCWVFYPHLRTRFSLLLEREEGGERERDHCDRETSIGCLLMHAPTRIESVNWVCVLTGNWTCNLSVFGTTSPNQPSHTSQAKMHNVFKTRSECKIVTVTDVDKVGQTQMQVQMVGILEGGDVKF